jgi:membrane protease YdiL (CAAX protease family)
VINLWEELGWTGFFQRGAVSRWGVVGGSLVTAVFFTAIHVPLTLGSAHDQVPVATNLLYLAVVAVGIRLLIARVDAWSGGSLLVIGILHSSFNAAEAVLEPEYAWVRVVVTAAAGLGVAGLGRPGRTAA